MSQENLIVILSIEKKKKCLQKLYSDVTTKKWEGELKIFLKINAI